MNNDMIKCLLIFTSFLGMACIIAYTYFIWCYILKMDKLIELLNEWLQTSDLWEFYDKIYYEEFCWGKVIKIMAKIRQKYKATGDRDADMTHLICLKKYEFIKWLVENNHIKWDVFCTVATPSSKYEDFDLWPETPREDYTNILLMDLAIQNNPIEFLISILK